MNRHFTVLAVGQAEGKVGRKMGKMNSRNMLNIIINQENKNYDPNKIPFYI